MSTREAQKVLWVHDDASTPAVLRAWWQDWARNELVDWVVVFSSDEAITFPKHWEVSADVGRRLYSKCLLAGKKGDRAWCDVYVLPQATEFFRGDEIRHSWHSLGESDWVYFPAGFELSIEAQSYEACFEFLQAETLLETNAVVLTGFDKRPWKNPVSHFALLAHLKQLVIDKKVSLSEMKADLDANRISSSFFQFATRPDAAPIAFAFDDWKPDAALRPTAEQMAAVRDGSTVRWMNEELARKGYWPRPNWRRSLKQTVKRLVKDRFELDLGEIWKTVTAKGFSRRPA
jgi:hypothetical protein